MQGLLFKIREKIRHYRIRSYLHKHPPEAQQQMQSPPVSELDEILHDHNWYKARDLTEGRKKK